MKPTLLSFSPAGRLRGKGKGVGEVQEGAREKLLGPYMVLPRPSCIAFAFVFHRAPNPVHPVKIPPRQQHHAITLPPNPTNDN